MAEAVRTLGFSPPDAPAEVSGQGSIIGKQDMCGICGEIRWDGKGGVMTAYPVHTAAGMC